MSQSSSPLPLSHHAPRVYRKKSASPVKPVRFSPYKLTRPSSSLVSLPGHTLDYLDTILPPTKYNLPVAPDTVHFSHEGEDFVSTRHIKLDFSLFRDGKQCMPSESQCTTIMALFPTCYNLTISPPFLIIVCRSLPAKPWPVTVAGWPLYLTTDPEANPIDIGLFSHGPKQTIEGDIGIQKMPTLQVFINLFAMFKKLGAKIERIQWTGYYFLAIGRQEPIADWRKILPWTVNDVRIGYMFKDPLLQEKALRRKVPSGRSSDDVEYTDLRPGLMVASKLDPANDFLTTSGVCVQSPLGKKYITVAKHGFPAGVEELVTHSNSNGRIIAKVDKVFRLTDIALAELMVPYSRTTFSTDDAPVEPFNNFAELSQVRMLDYIYMDTPFTGRCEGSLVKVDVLEIPVDEPADKTQYVIGKFVYFGNGSDMLFEGCCGAVIWDSDHNVLGQFRYQEHGAAELCYCPSFQTLKDLGYTLAEN